ncbi:hypothetical protein GCM10023205_38570 [Yinghuangia aomiensis]|uniref:Uncharacterized protein n=1 Tax=Yinghuangia aomiensis TaxID=676205 RepID=A0ABP9HF24_9ACTN
MVLPQEERHHPGVRAPLGVGSRGGDPGWRSALLLPDDPLRLSSVPAQPLWATGGRVPGASLESRSPPRAQSAPGGSRTAAEEDP